MKPTRGTCYCGTVTLTLAGAPRVAGLCHCQSCRRWHAAPVNAWCGWASDNVQISGPTIRSDVSPQSMRTACARCGGAVANEKPEFGVTVVYANTLDRFAFRPTLHLFYAERVLDMADGLPKYADMPSEMGGSGTLMDEPRATSYL